MEIINQKKLDKEINNSSIGDSITCKPGGKSSAFYPLSSNITNVQSDKCLYYLPHYIKWDAIDKQFMYRDDRSAEGNWIKTKSIRNAEIRSGYGKKQWAECPMYQKDINKLGYKYVPRNDVVMMKRYIEKYYPGVIKFRPNENINEIKRIWVYEDGYYSYKLEQKRKNLERNCTDGLECKNRQNGICSFNHYVDNGKSSNLCTSDINSQFSKCTKRICQCDHSIDRKARVDIIGSAIDNGILSPSYNSIGDTERLNIINLLNSGNINGMKIITDDENSIEYKKNSSVVEVNNSDNGYYTDDEEITNSFSEMSFSDVTDISYQSDDNDSNNEMDSSFYKRQPFEKSTSGDFNTYFKIGLYSPSPDFLGHCI